MVSQLSLKNNIWGKHGFPSYDDHSVSLETKLAVLKEMGYVDNEFFRFHDWIGTKKSENSGENYNDLGPFSIRLTYNPTIISTKPLTIGLYTSWDYRFDDCSIGCMIPHIPTITDGTWLTFPEEKNHQTWSAFYDRIIKVFATIESRLSTAEWFFQGDNFENYTAPKRLNDCQILESSRQWTFEGKPVDFQRIYFGPYGSYWGTLWYLCKKKEESKLFK